jgi:hypothetical protein
VMAPSARVLPAHTGIRCLACRQWVPRPREQPSGALTVPRPGDFWLCWKCGELHRFGELGLIGGIPSITIRLAALEEIGPSMDPADARDLLAMRDRIRGGAN